MKLLNYILLALIINACAPIYVSNDYEKTTNFNDYKTYNFFSNIESGLNDFDEKRFINALEGKLKSMGLQKSENASFLIDIKSDEFEGGSNNNVGVGVGGGNRGIGGGVSVGIPIGQSNINRQITVEFVDESKTGLFWQATSQCTFNPNQKPEKRELRFQAVVDKMLKNYPPKNKK